MPRVTIRRTWTPSLMPFASSVAYSRLASSSRPSPMSIASALAPSNRRSRWRSRKPSLPLWTRSPSHTPSPSMKPLSNTDTTASARGFNSPLTLIRIDAFRGSDTSCIDLVMGFLCAGFLVHGAARTKVQPPDDRELLGDLFLDRADDRFHVTRGDMVLEIHRQHRGDHVRGAV